MGNNNKKKIIGILGGIGHQTSHELYRMLIEKNIHNIIVKNNHDFPEKPFIKILK